MCIYLLSFRRAENLHEQTELFIEDRMKGVGNIINFDNFYFYDAEF